MRVAVSGSHSTGKSTLIAAFVDLRPQYLYEPEAYETLADDVALTAAEGPSPDGLQRARALADQSLRIAMSLASRRPGSDCTNA